MNDRILYVKGVNGRLLECSPIDPSALKAVEKDAPIRAGGVTRLPSCLNRNPGKPREWKK